MPYPTPLRRVVRSRRRPVPARVSARTRVGRQRGAPRRILATCSSGEGRIIKAEHAIQLRLLDLQTVDTIVAQLRHRRAHLPEQAQLSAAQQQRSVASEALVESETRVSDLELAQKQAEADLEPVRERRRRNQQRVDNGSVGDAKALSGLVDEIQHLSKRIGDLEDAELEVMEQLEAAVVTRDERAAHDAELVQKVSELSTRCDELVAGIDREIADQSTRRDGIALDIPAALLAAYDKSRASHGGVGAAELRNRRCTGCQLEVNAADLRTFAAAAEDDVLHCEECDRILIRTVNSGF